ncbi:MAG: putative transposase [Pirellulales bacterium]
MTTYAFVQSLLPLEAPAPDGRTFLNTSLWFVDNDGYRVVFHWHEPIYTVALIDEVHLRLVAVALRQSGLATQQEICQAFGHALPTQARWERQYRKQGMDGLVSKKPSGRGRELDKSQEGCVRRWFRAGCSNRQMAKRLAVDEATIRRTLKRLGWTRKVAAIPQMLPELDDQAAEVASAEASASAPAAVVESIRDAPAETPSPAVVLSLLPPEPCGQDAPVSLEPPVVPSFTLDRDPRDRSIDRGLARAGLLDDAAPLFADHESLPRAGALLAVPLLVRHGLIATFEKVYGSLHPSFYGLRTIVVTLFLGALLRIKRPEHWKEYLPEDLGAVLGLDRAPEVKTVRRKYTDLAARGRAKQLMDEAARRRIAQDEDRVAFLYVDGHVREYHGKFPLFEAKKAQRHVATPAATDTWVHDTYGEPLLVVTSEANAQLTQVLESILADVRRLVGDGRRITVIFDRGGFSPRLFARLIAAGFDVITYRKGKVGKLPSGRFTVEKEQIDGAWREYEVCDRPRVRVGVLPAEGEDKRQRAKARKRYLWMREVRVLRDGGRQTPILTNREDLSAVMVAYRMFHRWRQENYFKYAKEEFALDALIEYGAEELPAATDRRNPQWLRLTRHLKEARAKVARLQGELGKEAAANHEATRPTMRGFKIAHAALRQQLQQVERRIERLLQQRQKTPKRISAGDLKMLKTEKKLIADTIKMAAYQVETELLGMLQGHYARADEEGRTLLHAAFQSPARLEVTEGELRVTIARQSSPHRTAALTALCEQLDALAIPFPGTPLRLRLAVQAEKPITI